MTAGDLISETDQLQYRRALIDAAEDAESGAHAVLPIAGISGLRIPPRKRISTPVPMGHGAFPARDVWAPRKPTLTGIQVPSDEAASVLFAALWPNGPSAEDELVWRGCGWPDRMFRALARVDDATEVVDQEVFLSGFSKPTITFECFDPFVYDFDQRTLDDAVAAGATIEVDSHGTWETTRVRVTWTGPITNPGIATSAVAGGVISFAGLTLPDGETISAHFHRWTERFFTSSHFTTAQLGKAARGGGPPAAYAEPVFFPLVPATQTLTALGTGAGSMQVVWFDAHATPPAV